MKKPLLIVLILVVVALVAFLGLRSYTKSFSPEAVAEYNKNGLQVAVQYSRPSKKSRLIFGREQDNALVPYDKVWRTGANEATTIQFAQDVLFAGKPVKAGQYTLWTIPGPARWKVILNREVGQWGTNYNDGQDLFRSDVDIRIQPKVAEKFAIYFEDQPEGTAMILQWDQTEVIVPIRPK
ncbi:hypothetical protein GCM10027275_05490 [Rhabdobacter roseus]|uniref:DUF2911 domain-containing protein n=1 Tax=Rhabdobacter roseus TaxID=1655419 RepID=A0A840TRU1_9BACT|nr:DUF2911 domain-containing protein [Rhabdobacter roseus]MBB5282439.1 hypothetical protein [Rhabdobacter roseus]